MFSSILRSGEKKQLRAFAKLVPAINALEDIMAETSDATLQSKTGQFRLRVSNGESLDRLLPEAFAVAREAASRVIGERPYDVQLIGAAAMHTGCIAEMKTGEGKTLTAVLPAYLNSLQDGGVHIATVNSYLASRDSQWMGQILEWLGLSVGLVAPGVDGKQQAYACDVVYATNKELGFDYLRDNMVLSPADKVQREHSFCILDEIDSILIDEARTPLIVSGDENYPIGEFKRFAEVASGMYEHIHYRVDERTKHVTPMEKGIARAEELLEIADLYDGDHQAEIRLLHVALRAKEIFLRDRDYVVADGKVKMIDEFTGRIAPTRRWTGGLHQAIEAKEGVEIETDGQVQGSVSLQNYYRLYGKLAGMTGTAQSEASEFLSVYDLPVVQVPPNKPDMRTDFPDVIFRTEKEKLDAAVKDIAERHASGQPVLVGSISVENSEKISKLLAEAGVEHQVLNAKNNEREAEIIAQAGRLGMVTIATNMAGRGVDILLGGDPSKLAKTQAVESGWDQDTPAGKIAYSTALHALEAECLAQNLLVRNLGGLYVLGTERHASRRIDNQLRGRAGRQGDVGQTRFLLSLEDDMMRIFATKSMAWAMNKNFQTGAPIESRLVSRTVEKAQRNIEQHQSELRKAVLDYDEVLNEQRKTVYALRDQMIDVKTVWDSASKLVARFVDHVMSSWCASENSDDWDLDGMLGYLEQFIPLEEALPTIPCTRSVMRYVLVDIIEDLRDIDSPRPQSDIRLMVGLLDAAWRDHLGCMADLKEGIHLRALGHISPLEAWRREGFEMFEAMMLGVSEEYVRCCVMKSATESGGILQKPDGIQ